MDISDLAEKVVGAFEIDDLDEAITLLLDTFWNTTSNSREMLSFLQQVEKELAANKNTKEAELCSKLYVSYAAHMNKVKTIEPEWFVAEILRVTGWVTVPAPARYAEQYFERVEQRREILGALLGVFAEASAERAERRRAAERRDERCDRIRRFARKTGLIAAAPLSGGISLLFLALEE